MFCMTWFVTVLLPLYMRRRESITSRGKTLLNSILMIYDRQQKACEIKLFRINLCAANSDFSYITSFDYNAQCIVVFVVTGASLCLRFA